MSQAMSDRKLERWSGVVGFLVCVVVVVPVVLDHAAGMRPYAGPGWLWWAAYLSYLALLAGIDRPPRVLAERVPPWALIAAMVALGSAVVLLARFTGLTAVLLVFTAATAGYVLRPRALPVIIAVQTVVIGVSTAMEGAPLRWVLLSAFFYGVLQVLVVMAARVEQRSTRTKRELAEANLKLRTATALLEGTTRSNERLRIARELHDAVGHQLTVLALELEVASHQAGPPADEHVRRARAMAGQLLADVRAVVSELRERPPELREALAAVVADITDPQVALEVDEALALDERHVAALLRCVQEIVTNTIRHAEAEHLRIEVVAVDGGDVLLRAHDDGEGTPVLHLGNGLTGLRERIEDLGGSVRFDGQDGFLVEARLPAAARAAAASVEEAAPEEGRPAAVPGGATGGAGAPVEEVRAP